MAEKAYGLLINYEYCTGCMSCEMACSVEHDIPVGQYGIKMVEVGPWQIDKKNWQLDYVPIPTDMCDLCAGRIAKGKKPTCVKHCQSLCMEYGPVRAAAAYRERCVRDLRSRKRSCCSAVLRMRSAITQTARKSG